MMKMEIVVVGVHRDGKPYRKEYVVLRVRKIQD
jgi:hypothetical protein